MLYFTTFTFSSSIFKYLDKTLVQLGIIGFLSMAIEGAMFDWSGVYFQDIVKALFWVIPPLF
jgi:hypothetical protein